MKELIKSIKPKKQTTDEIADLLEFEQKDFIEWFIKEAHRAKNTELINELYSKMEHIKFAKALRKLLKSTMGLDCGFAVVISAFLEKYLVDVKKEDSNKELNTDLVEIYNKVTRKVLKERVKEVNRKLGINEDVILELLIVTPDIGYISNDKFVGIYSQKMLRKMYAMAGNKNIDLNIKSVKQIKKMFTRLFGENLIDLIAINILLEKSDYSKNLKTDSQKELWNLMTEFALGAINKEDKDHIVELLEYYCTRRKVDVKKDRDAKRRVSFDEIDTSKYSRLAKGLKTFKKNAKEDLIKFL